MGNPAWPFMVGPYFHVFSWIVISRFKLRCKQKFSARTCNKENKMFRVQDMAMNPTERNVLRVFKTKSTALWSFFSKKKWERRQKIKKMREVKNERDCAQRLSLKKMLRHDDIYFLTSYIMYALWSLWSVLTFWVERGENTQCVHQSKLQWQSCQEMGKSFEACSRLTIFSPKYDHLWGFYRALFRPLRAEIEMLPNK